jgi:hypothetical protein
VILSLLSSCICLFAALVCGVLKATRQLNGTRINLEISLPAYYATSYRPERAELVCAYIPGSSPLFLLVDEIDLIVHGYLLKTYHGQQRRRCGPCWYLSWCCRWSYSPFRPSRAFSHLASFKNITTEGAGRSRSTKSRLCISWMAFRP